MQSEIRSFEQAKKPKLLSLFIGFITTLIVPISVFVMPSNAQNQKRPVYIVAHRCNVGSGVKNAVQNHGVNAIEADFWYYNSEWIVVHDNPAVTNAPKLNDWLNEVRTEATRAGSPLALLHIDIKTPDAPLKDLYAAVRTALPSVNLIFDIGLVKDGVHLAKIKDKILNDSRAVAAMGFDDSPTDVNAFFKKEGYPLHKYWYEIGIAAGAIWSTQEQDWAREAINLRNAGRGPKVVIWTFEQESTVKYWLEQGVDAILVNSSQCYGRTTAFATDADVHVKNAKNLANAAYGSPSDEAFPAVSVRDRKRAYQVSIKTGDKTGAGTDSNVFMTIYGENGQTVETRLNGLISGNAFERNKIDDLTLKDLPDIGFLKKVTIRSDGSYAGAAWYLESVTINGRTARFNTWVESGKLTAEASF